MVGMYLIKSSVVTVHCINISEHKLLEILVHLEMEFKEDHLIVRPCHGSGS
jgi:hypothetical protein